MSSTTQIPAAQEFVYVIHAIGTNRIKLGFSTKPKERLAGLQTASPFPLQMLACWPGSRAREDRLHRYMNRFRKVGEWFEAEPFCGLKLWELATKGEVTGSVRVKSQRKKKDGVSRRIELISEITPYSIRLPGGYQKRVVNGAFDIIQDSYIWDDSKQKKVRYRPYVARISAQEVQRLGALCPEDQLAEIQRLIDEFHIRRNVKNEGEAA